MLDFMLSRIVYLSVSDRLAIGTDSAQQENAPVRQHGGRVKGTGLKANIAQRDQSRVCRIKAFRNTHWYTVRGNSAKYQYSSIRQQGGGVTAAGLSKPNGKRQQ